jgi:hypothetical protein
VVNSWSTPQLDNATPDGNAGRVAIEAGSRRPPPAVVRGNGIAFADAVKRANTRGFRAEPLRTTASASLHNAIRRTSSHNVVALLPGTKRPDEYIVYMAHWDHLGRMPDCTGDCIFNGAVDNATGTAGVLTIAKAFTQARVKPERSIVFMAVTLEESGCWGRLTTSHTRCFRSRTRWRRSTWTQCISAGRRGTSPWSTSARRNSRAIWRRGQGTGSRASRRAHAGEGTFFRSDHFNFAKRGVPALYIKGGIDDREHGEAWREKHLADFTAQKYTSRETNIHPMLTCAPAWKTWGCCTRSAQDWRERKTSELEPGQ